MYRIGILVLIDEHIAKLVLVFVQYIRKAVQQLKHFQQQVVKIHGAIAKAALAIGSIDASDFRFLRAHIFLLNGGLLCIYIWIDQGVLRPGDSASYGSRLIFFIIEPQLTNHCFDYRSTVFCVVDGEVGRIAQVPCFRAQDAREYAVKGAYI